MSAYDAPGVVFLGHTATIGGGEVALLRLLPELADLDPLVVLGQQGPLVAALESIGCPVRVLALGETAELRRDAVSGRRLPLASVGATCAYAVRLARELRRLRPRLVHTNTLKAHLYGGAAARLAGVPQVWHARDRIAADYLPAPAVRMVRLAARRLPAAVIANSHETLSTVPGAPLGTVVYDSTPVVVAAAAEPALPLVVGHVGRLSPWKGQDVFLQAFAQAFPSGRERALVVGGPLFGEEGFERGLHELVGALGLTGRVQFTGQVPDVGAELGRMHVLVHSSTIPEPFGQVVVEGQAAGLAVVAAAAGGPAEFVRPGETGLLTPPGDVPALAAALRTLADDDALRHRLAAAGRQASLAFTPAATAAGVRAVYDRVLSAR